MCGGSARAEHKTLPTDREGAMPSAGAPDPRTPVLIGVGQTSNRVDRGEAPVDPVELIARAARLAGEDARCPDALRAIDSVRVMSIFSWRYRDPGALVAELLGATPEDSAYAVTGGNYVQTVLNMTGREILAGTRDLVLIAGGEAWRTRTEARKSDGTLSWRTQGDEVPAARQIGEDKGLSHELEVKRGVFLPIQTYAVQEIALRHALGLTPEEHQGRICGLWSRFSAVAAKNPNAWIQHEYSAEDLRRIDENNRMVCYPYPKLLNSNNNVEQAAALLMCSVERAQALGVPRDRWVFLHSGTDASDHWYLTERDALYESPAIRLAAAKAIELAETDVGAIDHVDLYSCFPSAVQIAAREIGLEVTSQLTVTGGMSFAGGPWNNYAMHGVATMADVLRDNPGGIGLTSANGGYTTKHAFGVWSTEPPPQGAFRSADLQAEVDKLPLRQIMSDYVGGGSIEAYTVVHDRESGPDRALISVLTPEGGRTWGVSRDSALMESMETEDLVGATGRIVDGDGAFVSDQ